MTARNVCFQFSNHCNQDVEFGIVEVYKHVYTNLIFDMFVSDGKDKTGEPFKLHLHINGCCV